MSVLFHTLGRSPGLPEIAIDKAENLLEELVEERSREADKIVSSLLKIT